MNRMLACLVPLVLLTPAITGQSERPAQPTPDPRALRPGSLEGRLDAVVPEVLLQDQPFEQIMEWLADYTGANVWVRWQALEDAGIERDKPITITARNLRLSQILHMILTEAGGTDTPLGYAVGENLLTVSTRADLSTEQIVKVYDVRDLLARASIFAQPVRLDVGQALASADGGAGSGGLTTETDTEPPQETLEDAVSKLIDVIVQTVEPDTWTANGGRGSIAAWRGKLIVRNSAYVHQQLGGTLAEIKTP